MRELVPRLKTVVVLGALAAVVVLVGARGWPDSVWPAGLIALAVTGLVYFYSDKLLLAMRGAYEVARPDAPELHRLVAHLADRARVPRPRLYLIDDPRPNAFATGRSPRCAAIAMTTGLPELLTRSELRAVIAHEIGHVASRDILPATIGAMLAALVTTIAAAITWRATNALGFDAHPSPSGGILGGVALAIVTPILRLTIPHSREYRADAAGAQLTGQPRALARALAKLDRSNRAAPALVGDHVGAATLCIHSRIEGRLGVLSTHPSLQERIARLVCTPERLRLRMPRSGRQINGLQARSATSISRQTSGSISAR